MVHLFLIENEEVLGALIVEDSEMKMKLKDQGSPPRYLKNKMIYYFGKI